MTVMRAVAYFSVFVSVILSLGTAQNDDCGPSTFTNKEGTISSPGYPQPYKRDTDCYYNITVWGASSISVHWNSAVDLEKEACNATLGGDFLYITLSNGTQMEELCGANRTQEDFTVEGDSLFFRFVTDRSGAAGKGFSFQYTANYSNGGDLNVFSVSKMFIWLLMVAFLNACINNA
ncbi:mannan-binding lectin serine protease 1 [Lingula anatina]|uniref:Mannan-binding lectin serine protease 1 n=1 Tax=Lingula anatina TaxID=7574 RepID=A0A1S3J8E5_LINAN|nr:mannan-binding lectin serine protease 1 [Lingula anatina]|eukprot:XP_013406583.1 mannan-binding lectin serine protease 1 [Lingula anatina]